MSGAVRRVAVVLLNLGGPDGPDTVRPFLFNLFSDPAVLRLPGLIRWPLAWFIAAKRTREAKQGYDRIGGGSPLLETTRHQAAALQAALDDANIGVFIAMRYWHPMADETVQQVADFSPDQVLLLPLFPQYSATTTASSARIWRQAARICRLSAPVTLLCCYPVDSGFVEASVALIRPALQRAAGAGRPRLLFFGHGLLESVVRSGDPYQRQCESTAKAIVERLAIDDLDWVVCFQGRTGPPKGIGPSTEREIDRAGADGVPIVVFPLAVVSECFETLVEIGILHRERASAGGVPYFEAVSAVGTHPEFIAGLAALVRSTTRKPPDAVANGIGGRTCPVACSGCPWPRKGI